MEWLSEGNARGVVDELLDCVFQPQGPQQRHGALSEQRAAELRVGGSDLMSFVTSTPVVSANAVVDEILEQLRPDPEVLSFGQRSRINSTSWNTAGASNMAVTGAGPSASWTACASSAPLHRPTTSARGIQGSRAMSSRGSAKVAADEVFQAALGASGPPSSANNSGVEPPTVPPSTLSLMGARGESAEPAMASARSSASGAGARRRSPAATGSGVSGLSGLTQGSGCTAAGGAARGSATGSLTVPSNDSQRGDVGSTCSIQLCNYGAKQLSARSCLTASTTRSTTRSEMTTPTPPPTRLSRPSTPSTWSTSTRPQSARPAWKQRSGRKQPVVRPQSAGAANRVSSAATAAAAAGLRKPGGPPGFAPGAFLGPPTLPVSAAAAQFGTCGANSTLIANGAVAAPVAKPLGASAHGGLTALHHVQAPDEPSAGDDELLLAPAAVVEDTAATSADAGDALCLPPALGVSSRISAATQPTRVGASATVAASFANAEGTCLFAPACVAVSSSVVAAHDSTGGCLHVADASTRSASPPELVVPETQAMSIVSPVAPPLPPAPVVPPVAPVGPPLRRPSLGGRIVINRALAHPAAAAGASGSGTSSDTSDGANYRSATAGFVRDVVHNMAEEVAYNAAPPRSSGTSSLRGSTVITGWSSCGGGSVGPAPVACSASLTSPVSASDRVETPGSTGKSHVSPPFSFAHGASFASEGPSPPTAVLGPEHPKAAEASSMSDPQELLRAAAPEDRSNVLQQQDAAAAPTAHPPAPPATPEVLSSALARPAEPPLRPALTGASGCLLPGRPTQAPALTAPPGDGCPAVASRVPSSAPRPAPLMNAGVPEQAAKGCDAARSSRDPSTSRQSGTEVDMILSQRGTSQDSEIPLMVTNVMREAMHDGSSSVAEEVASSPHQSPLSMARFALQTLDSDEGQDVHDVDVELHVPVELLPTGSRLDDNGFQSPGLPSADPAGEAVLAACASETAWVESASGAVAKAVSEEDFAAAQVRTPAAPAGEAALAACVSGTASVASASGAVAKPASEEDFAATKVRTPAAPVSEAALAACASRTASVASAVGAVTKPASEEDFAATQAIPIEASPVTADDSSRGPLRGNGSVTVSVASVGGWSLSAGGAAQAGGSRTSAGNVDGQSSPTRLPEPLAASSGGGSMAAELPAAPEASAEGALRALPVSSGTASVASVGPPSCPRPSSAQRRSSRPSCTRGAAHAPATAQLQHPSASSHGDDAAAHAAVVALMPAVEPVPEPSQEPRPPPRSPSSVGSCLAPAKEEREAATEAQAAAEAEVTAAPTEGSGQQGSLHGSLNAAPAAEPVPTPPSKSQSPPLLPPLPSLPCAQASEEAEAAAEVEVKAVPAGVVEEVTVSEPGPSEEGPMLDDASSAVRKVLSSKDITRGLDEGGTFLVESDGEAESRAASCSSGRLLRQVNFAERVRESLPLKSTEACPLDNVQSAQSSVASLDVTGATDRIISVARTCTPEVIALTAPVTPDTVPTFADEPETQDWRESDGGGLSSRFLCSSAGLGKVPGMVKSKQAELLVPPTASCATTQLIATILAAARAQQNHPCRPPRHRNGRPAGGNASSAKSDSGVALPSFPAAATVVMGNSTSSGSGAVAAAPVAATGSTVPDASPAEAGADAVASGEDEKLVGRSPQELMSAMEANNLRIRELSRQVCDAEMLLAERREYCDSVREQLTATRLKLAHLDVDIQGCASKLQKATERRSELKARERRLLEHFSRLQGLDDDDKRREPTGSPDLAVPPIPGPSAAHGAVRSTPGFPPWLAAAV